METVELRTKGLVQKYIVTHADGSKLEPGARYFVLRIDESFAEGKDTPSNIAHRRACRHAARVYAKGIAPYFPKLSEELLARCADNEKVFVWKRRNSGKRLSGR